MHREEEILTRSKQSGTRTEFSLRKKVHELGKDDASLVHADILSVVLKGSITTEMACSKLKSLQSQNTYNTLHDSYLTTPNTFFLGHY